MKRVFELTSHTSGVYDVAFDADSSHMATVSKDGTWKLFKINGNVIIIVVGMNEICNNSTILVEYKKGEDPRLLKTVKYEQTSTPALIALSPNSEVVVIAASNNLYFYSTSTGELDNKITNIYTGKYNENILISAKILSQNDSFLWFSMYFFKAK